MKRNPANGSLQPLFFVDGMFSPLYFTSVFANAKSNPSKASYLEADQIEIRKIAKAGRYELGYLNDDGTFEVLKHPDKGDYIVLNKTVTLLITKSDEKQEVRLSNGSTAMLYQYAIELL
jgi:hypothetical protein